MAATVYDQAKKLNPKELHYVATHPYHVLAIKDSFSKAVAETERRFAINGLDDESDAFRHCYWSALLGGQLQVLVQGAAR